MSDRIRFDWDWILIGSYWIGSDLDLFGVGSDQIGLGSDLDWIVLDWI